MLNDNFSCLLAENKELEAHIDTLKLVTISHSPISLDTSSPRTNKCERCCDHDIDACATNLERIGMLEEQIRRFKLVVREEMFSNNDGSSMVETKFKPIRSHKGKALGSNPYKVNLSVENNG